MRSWPPPPRPPHRSATPSRSGSPPRTRPATSRPGRAASAAGSCRTGRGSGSTPGSRWATASRPTTTTWSRRSWSTPRTGRRHRPPAAGARRDRDRRHPDDAAVRPLRGPHPGFRGGRAVDRLGGRGMGRAGRASAGLEVGGAGCCAGRSRPERSRRRARPPPPPGGSPPHRPSAWAAPPGPTRSTGGRDDPPPRHGPGHRRGLVATSTRPRARDGTSCRPSDRLVLPGLVVRRPPVAGRRRGRRRRLAVRARGRGRRSGRPPRPGHARAARRRAPRADRGSCHHPRTGRVRGRRRRGMPSWPASGSWRWRR